MRKPVPSGVRMLPARPGRMSQTPRFENVAFSATSSDAGRVSDRQGNQRLERGAPRHRPAALALRKMSRVAATFFPGIQTCGTALSVDGLETGPYGRLTQTIPVGEPAFLLFT